MARIIAFPNLLNADRLILEVKAGMSVKEAVELAVPSLHYAGTMVILNDAKVTPDDTTLKDGDTLIVRAVPGDGSAVSIGVGGALVLVGALATATGIGAIAGIPLMAIGLGLIGIGATNYIQGLIPKPNSIDTSTTPGSLGIHGGSNSLKPYEPVPVVLGKSIIAPPLGSKTYTTWDGATIPNQILNQLFVVGLGRYAITNQKIGDKAVGQFAALTINQQNMSNDTYGQIVTEAGVGLEVKFGTSLAITQVTAADIDAITIDISFPSGLCSYDSQGNRGNSRGVGITLEYQKSGGAWPNAPIALGYVAGTNSAYTQQAGVSAALLTAAGRSGYTGTWDVRLTRTLADSTDSKNVDMSVWSVMRSYQFKEPMSAVAKSITTRIALTVKATDQLNGAIDNLNVEAQSIVPCWNGVS